MSPTLFNLRYLAAATRFRRISEKLQIDGDRIYKDYNIDFKASWFSIFYILTTSEQPKTVLELADEIGFSHITVKNVVRELQENGLVDVTEHPTDKRSKHITLAAEGKARGEELQRIWQAYASSLKHLMDAGHPDFLNIIHRIDEEIAKNPLSERLKVLSETPVVRVLDYKPSLKKYLFELAGYWLLDALKGALEEDDKFTLHNPDKAYVENGGFVFFALYAKKVVGCVALKRLDEDTFELAKLFVDPSARKLGIATKLIERCMSRCKENNAQQLWLQTTMAEVEAHKLYGKLGFLDQVAPPQMTMLRRTEKVMVMEW